MAPGSLPGRGVAAAEQPLAAAGAPWPARARRPAGAWRCWSMPSHWQSCPLEILVADAGHAHRLLVTLGLPADPTTVAPARDPPQAELTWDDPA